MSEYGHDEATRLEIQRLQRRCQELSFKLDECQQQQYSLAHDLEMARDVEKRALDRLGAYQTLCKDLWTWAVTVEGCQLPQDLYKELELTQIHGVTYPEADNAPAKGGHRSTAERSYDELVPKNFQEGGTATTWGGDGEGK